MDVNQFVQKCEDILAVKGEDVDYGSVQSHCAISCRRYEDDVIVIASGTYDGKNLFEVVVMYVDDGFKVENPCIMITDGDMFRYHGDWRRAESHIEMLTGSL